MDESKDNKFATYWEVILMLSYFWIPFLGMLRALKKFTETDDLPIMSILLLLFISANIATWLILLLDGKTILVKSLCMVGLVLMMIVLIFLV
jgi:hypothetical protein